MNRKINTQLTGIILAGGKGIRLGHDKGMAKLHGRHLIEFVIDNLSVLCDEILISSNSDQCKQFGYTTIPDLYHNKGPMAGIHACLKASSNKNNFVLSVDTPFVSPEFIKYMLASKKDSFIAAPWYGLDHYEPLCAYYSKQAVPVMESFFEEGNYKLPDVFQALPFMPISIHKTLPFYHPMLFHNINTREDLLLAEQYLKKTSR